MISDELQPVPVDVPLFAGQNSAMDSRIVDVGALPLVENGRFYTNGQLQKRFGLTSLSSQDTGGNTFSQGREVFSSGNSLFFHDGNNLYIYNALNSNWVPLGGLNTATVQSTVLAQSRNDVTEISSAASPNAVCVAWSEAGAVYCSVYNPANNTFLQAATQLSATGERPNVVCIGNDFFVAWVETISVNVSLARIGGTNLTQLGTIRTAAEAGTSGSGLTSTKHYDMCTNNNKVYIAASLNTSGNPIVYLSAYDTSLNFVSGLSVQSFTWNAESSVWCFGLDAGTVVFGNQWAWTTTQNLGPYAFSTPRFNGHDFNVRRIYGTGTNTNNVCWGELQNTANGNTQIYLERCSFTIVGASETFADANVSWFTNPNSYIVSRPFSADGTVYIWALTDFKLQNQLIMIDANGRAVARALTNGNAAPADSNSISLPTVASQVDSAGATNYYMAARRRAQLKFDANGNAYTSIGAALLNLKSQHPTTQAVTVGNSTYIGGAAPKLYDGRSLSELGFWFYSDTPTLTVLPGAGSLSAGTYTYALCFACYDNQGKIWRSPLVLVPPGNTQPNGSSGASVTVAANAAVQISNITYLQGSTKTNVFIEVYRTRANLTQLYKVTEINNTNQLNYITTTYTDAASDASLVGEQAYTDGSTPSYISPPGFSYITATPNRVYGLCSETNEVWVSNLTTTTTPAQFLLGQTLQVPTLTSPPTCMEILDGQLYVFTADAILNTNADGSYLSQTNSVQFAPPRVLPVDAGCVAPASLLKTDMGLWYQSAKGITLLERTQQVNFVGDAVKNYTDTILGTLALPLQQQLRFVSSNQTLVYDYVYNRWSVYTGQTPVSACRWLNSYVMCTSDGKIKQEIANTFTDDGVHFTRKVITPWIKPSGINGYARCWRFVILGEGRAPHTLQVRIAYQYDEAWIDTLQIASSAANPNGIYGAGLGTYGKTKAGLYGATPASTAYQFEAVMPRQKATAFRFEITDISNSGSGEAAALTVLSLQCGVYGGLARLPATKRTG